MADPSVSISMEETISITSSGNTSATSDDFEMLEPTSPQSPITVPQTGLSTSATIKKNGCTDKSNADNAASVKCYEPEIAIANNGNMKDLQKQMSEVLQESKSSTSDNHITRESDPAILKSLDTSPESALCSPMTSHQQPTISSSIHARPTDFAEGIGSLKLSQPQRVAAERNPLELNDTSSVNSSENANNDKENKVSTGLSMQSCIQVSNSDGNDSEHCSDSLSAVTPTADNPSSEEYTLFNGVMYLGAASISSACTPAEIYHNMSILCSQVKEQAIEVLLSVPSHSEGDVIIYDAATKTEITKYHIYTIRKCTRGSDTKAAEESCFAFTTKHGTSPATSIVQCHVFRCQIPEAAGRIVESFGAAFRRVPKSVSSGAVGTVGAASVGSVASSSSATSASSSIAAGVNTTALAPLQYMFDIALEIKEEDSKGNFYTVPRDRDCFKLRCNVEKQLHITVSPSPPSSSSSNGVPPSSITSPSDGLIIERCFGLLVAAGHKVKHADMNLLEMVSSSSSGPPSIAAQGSSAGSVLPQNKGSYIVSGHWDPRDPVFASLNQETAKDGRVLMSVAVDLVIKGIQEPVRFVLDTKVRIYHQNERFWSFTKKPPVYLFSLKLKQADMSSSTSSLEAQYEVITVENRGEVERFRAFAPNGLSLPLNLSSLTSSTLSTLSGGMRSPSISSIDTPGADEDSDDDEPLLSGSGEVSKECSQTELDQWKLVLPKWQSSPAQCPKGVAKLVKKGVPEALRGEVWQLLAGCSHNDSMMETYRMLLTKECPSDQVILRDINRTFPAHDFFKESGGGGQDALYKISRAYAVYDEELAYCQGLSFLAAALLLHMPEEQAFCVLVKIMSDYGFRNMFKDSFAVLHLRLYQLDRLMEDYINDVYNHFQEYGVASHMFASQWFLTLYTAKFPLYMVFHSLDLFLLKGFESVFQVAIALLMMSRKELVSLDFEGILKYFRVSLPKKYRNEENVKALFRLASELKMKRLEKYEREYLLLKEQESSESTSERLQQENRKLLEEKLRLDAENDTLVRSNDMLDEARDRLNKELLLMKQAYTDADQERQRLLLEAVQVKELLKKEVKKSDEELNRNSAILSEYKTICSQLSQRIDSEHNQHQKTLDDLKTRAVDCTVAGCKCRQLLLEPNAAQEPLLQHTDPLTAAAAEEDSASNKGRTKILSNQVRELELELAQTKLALVEAQCKNQHLTHQLNAANTELQANKNTWLQKTLTSISGLKERAPTATTNSASSSSTGGNSRPISPTTAKLPFSRGSSIDSTASGGVHRGNAV